ncbi:MAG: hypothetical protein HYZ61_01890 [Candidatus Andersenbacteria bacterium]|nr:hypothetical protein [Candidatus Andersenbacteria bacterium]
MHIYVTSGTGTGPTPLAAFDAAVMAASESNHNMIYLSCFIPPGSVIVRARNPLLLKSWGQRIYVVMSRQDASEIGQEAWTSLGWVQDQSGRGMFVEHHGRSKKEVHNDIQATLNFMVRSRNMDFGPIEHELTGIKCEGQPVCAVTMAVYKIENWES